MNSGMNNQLARERTRDLLAARPARTPYSVRPSHDRTHGLIGRLRAARAR
jgi:hypothetical protein